MKTRELMKLAMILIAVAGISITGCKKEDKSSKENDDTSTLQQLSKDDNQMQSATDDGLNDVTACLSSGTSKATEELPCDVKLDSTSVINDTVTWMLTFTGSNCLPFRTRTGQINVSKKVGQRWSDTGAAVIVKFIGFKVTKKYTGNSIIINGTRTFTNINGGLIKDLGNGTTTVADQITGSLQVTFDDNTTRTWNVARKRTFTGTYPDALVLTIDGTGSDDGYDNLVTWGVNRHGEAFYTQITQSVVCKESCYFQPVSGIQIYQIPGQDIKATLTFGFDDNNQPVSGSNCPTRFKLDWEKGEHSGTLFLQLP